MLTPKQIIVKIGPQHLGKGVSLVLKEIDNVFPTLPIKASLIGNLGFTALGVAGGFLAPKPFDEVLTIWGGFHSTELWDYISGGITPPAAGLSFKQGNGGARLIPTRPGLSESVITRPKVQIGPYAGGMGAPKFTPGVLRPKFALGA